MDIQTLKLAETRLASSIVYLQTYVKDVGDIKVFDGDNESQPLKLSDIVKDLEDIRNDIDIILVEEE